MSVIHSFHFINTLVLKVETADFGIPNTCEVLKSSKIEYYICSLNILLLCKVR